MSDDVGVTSDDNITPLHCLTHCVMVHLSPMQPPELRTCYLDNNLGYYMIIHKDLEYTGYGYSQLRSFVYLDSSEENWYLFYKTDKL